MSKNSIFCKLLHEKYRYFFSGIRCVLLLFIATIPIFSSSGLARTTLVLSPMPKEEPKPSLKTRVVERVFHHQRNKPRGVDDPHFPVLIEVDPHLIALPKVYQLPEDFKVVDGKLDLTSLTPQAVGELSYAELKILMNYLMQIDVKVRWWDKHGHVRSGKNRKHKIPFARWDHTNAAAALVLNYGILGEEELFAVMVTLAPEAILPEFKDDAAALLNTALCGRILSLMVSQIDFGNSTNIAKSVAALTQIYIKYWARKDVEKLKRHLVELMEQTKINLERVDKSFKPQRVGILLGGVLAGVLMHANAIHEKDNRRMMIVNALSNIIWAATTFVGVAPIVSSVVAVTAGGLSMAAVIGAVAYNGLGIPRDFVPSIKETEGIMEGALLESAQESTETEKLNALMTLSWMRMAIHANGLSD